MTSQQLGNSAKTSTVLTSKRKRANSMLTLSSKRANGFHEPSLPASATQSIAGSSSRLSSVQVTSSHQPHILKSAFRIPSIPTSQWSREVSLTDSRFTHSTAEYQLSGSVKISRLANLVLKYRKVTRPGIEPRTFWTYTRCSNQLSYLALEFNQLILYLCNCQPKNTYSAKHIQCHSLHARSIL